MVRRMVEVVRKSSVLRYALIAVDEVKIRIGVRARVYEDVSENSQG